MMKMILLSYLALALSLGAPYLSTELSVRDKPAEPVAVSVPLPPEERVQPAPVLTASEIAAEPSPDAVLPPAPDTVSVLTGDTVTVMDADEYILGVLAAEMPASFPEEALKAQAVAARTYAMYCASSAKHGEAEVCTDFACCQAWQSEEALREKWGGDYEANIEKLRAAVTSTAGQYLSYEGEPVFAAFHSSSAGMTEASSGVWNPLPYLISVDTPETAETVPNFVSMVECSALDFRDTILSKHPEADFSVEESAWIGETVPDESGRVASVVLGGVSIRGTELRSLFSLRSTAFELKYTEGRFVFTVTGHGHGVGMSQYGASVLASQGAAYEEILSHYYPGTVLVK